MALQIDSADTLMFVACGIVLLVLIVHVQLTFGRKYIIWSTYTILLFCILLWWSFLAIYYTDSTTTLASSSHALSPIYACTTIVSLFVSLAVVIAMSDDPAIRNKQQIFSPYDIIYACVPLLYLYFFSPFSYHIDAQRTMLQFWFGVRCIIFLALILRTIRSARQYRDGWSPQDTKHTIKTIWIWWWLALPVVGGIILSVHGITLLYKAEGNDRYSRLALFVYSYFIGSSLFFFVSKSYHAQRSWSLEHRTRASMAKLLIYCLTMMITWYILHPHPF